MSPFEQLQANSPYRAIFRDRTPDPGECVVVDINWERNTVAMTNGAVRYAGVEVSDVFLWRKPDLTDPLEKLRAFLLPDDINLTTPMDLMDELYARASRAHRIEQVENGTSWDYCKVTSIDWINKTPRWIPIHKDAYWYQMGCVPPHFQRSGMTMTGEEYSRCYHLTLLDRGPGGFWCCLLKKSQVCEPSFIATIPFADVPMLGLPDNEPDSKDYISPEMLTMCWEDLSRLLWNRANSQADRPLSIKESELLDSAHHMNECPEEVAP